MNSAPPFPAHETTGESLEHREEIATNTYHWLLVLGFPPADAAVCTRPDIFRP